MLIMKKERISIETGIVVEYNDRYGGFIIVDVNKHCNDVIIPSLYNGVKILGILDNGWENDKDGKLVYGPVLIEIERFDKIATKTNCRPIEILLNTMLDDECMKINLCFKEIERLLSLGANPLGTTITNEIVYGRVVAYWCEERHEKLLEITKLFLKYGMDIDNPPMPYDYADRSNPMDSFSLSCSENSIKVLQLLIDKGLSIESLRMFWGIAVSDIAYSDTRLPQKDEECNYEYEWLMKSIMLCASYDRILSQDEELRKYINVEDNCYDVKQFRQWDDFVYEIEAERDDEGLILVKMTVKIYEKSSGQLVWKFVDTN